MTSFSFELPDRAAARLREIAEVNAETPDSLILRAVEDFIEDYALGRIAMERLADQSEPTISLAELRRRLADD